MIEIVCKYPVTVVCCIGILYAIGYVIYSIISGREWANRQFFMELNVLSISFQYSTTCIHI